MYSNKYNINTSFVKNCFWLFFKYNSKQSS